MKRHSTGRKRVLRATALIGLISAGAPAARAVLPVADDPRIDRSKLRVTTFATGLSYPTGMQRLADGSLLVATSVSTAGGFYNSSGQLLRLVDTDGDGDADGTPKVLYSGLPGSLSAVQKAGEYTVVSSGSPGNITVLKDGATPADPMSLVGNVQFAFAPDARHRTYSLAARPISDGHEIYFNVGSRYNDQATPDPVAVSDLVGGRLNADSIYRFTLTGSGASPTVGNLQQIASGLRNAAGLGFRANGDLYLQDNGIDGPGDASLSADELNKVSASELGNVVVDFGFPSRYTDYSTGDPVGSGGVDPVVSFTPQNGRKSEGAAQIAFSPAAFSGGLDDGVFVGFHGRFNDAGAANDENALLFYVLGTKQYFPVVLPGSDGIGHFDGLLSTADSLFIADLNANGSTGEINPAGTIYQITAIPEPVVLGTLSLLPLLTLRGRRRL